MDAFHLVHERTIRQAAATPQPAAAGGTDPGGRFEWTRAWMNSTPRPDDNWKKQPEVDIMNKSPSTKSGPEVGMKPDIGGIDP
ncbi:hypothetical protein [Nitrospirillum amazonense]|uniref:hypothetical protein n=1 Tax=Nitrospirillum amazonense TaxID=28077 RepID=UPI001645F99A|nr:hypothetical protein [Nitrospirillum amazonense]